MVVGVGPGFDYSQDGISHYCLEDLAMVQSQPGVGIQTPFTSAAVDECVKNYVKNPKPTYLRLPRNVDQHKVNDFLSTEPRSVDVLIYCTALMSRRAHEVSEKLKGLDIDSVIGSTHEISAKSDKNILEHIKKAKRVLVIEDHYEFGGIGTRINELVSSNQLNIPVVKDSVTGIPSGSIGDFAYMESKLMKEIEVVVGMSKYENSLYFNDKMGINRWMERKCVLTQLSKMLSPNFTMINGETTCAAGMSLAVGASCQMTLK
jgi:transketolase C-terminal domain/subunit